MTDAEKAMLSSLAEKVRKRSLAYAVSLAVESSRPLHNLGAQSAVFLTPFLTVFLKREQVEAYIRVLENSNAVEFFLKELNKTETKEGPNVRE